MGTLRLGERVRVVASTGRRPASKLSVAAGFFAAATGATVVLGLAGFPVSPRFLTALAIASVPLALAASIAKVVAIRRGPPLRSFSAEDAAACGEPEAAAVRAFAQVRGGLGGAGHVHPFRLLLPAVAWLAAGALAVFAAARGVDCEGVRVALEGLAVSAAAAAIFPARPFWYLEHRDGTVLLYPPALRTRMASDDASVRG